MLARVALSAIRNIVVMSLWRTNIFCILFNILIGTLKTAKHYTHTLLPQLGEDDKLAEAL